MDENLIKQAKKNLLDINKTITSLDPAIRAAAFEILAPYYFDEYEPPANDEDGGKDKRKKRKPIETGSMEAFFVKHEHGKPKDNVFLIAAWLYSQHGVIPVTAKLCEQLADKNGIVIPNRPDNTMRHSTRKGKGIFRQEGKGWLLTTQGELYVKETYNIRKGNKPPPDTGDK